MASACVPASEPPQPVSPPVQQPPLPPTNRAPLPPRSVQPQPPADLLNAVQALGRGFDGTVGIAVRDVDAGWLVSYNGDQRLPQQSVSKLWVAITVMDLIDQGRMSLDDAVTVERSDLTLFHQPIRPLVGANGYRTSVRALLELAMTKSDNTANDVLLWKAGGPDAVNAMLRRKGIEGVTFGPGERILQAKTAGLTWRPEWAGGEGFLRARAAMDYADRDRAMQRYLADPYDGATANGVTLGLNLLERGTLLSRRSTDHLIGLMNASRTGPSRMKGGLAPGWHMAHKTGTGQDFAGRVAGYNDVGILEGPGGKRFAVAVMIGTTRRTIPVRQDLMQSVTRAVIDTTR